MWQTLLMWSKKNAITLTLTEIQWNFADINHATVLIFYKTIGSLIQCVEVWDAYENMSTSV